MVQVTIIATGFEEAQAQLARAEQEIKVKATVLDVGAACELKQEAHVPPAPKAQEIAEKQPISAILSGFKKQQELPTRELLVGDDALDVPSFMRKAEKTEIEK